MNDNMSPDYNHVQVPHASSASQVCVNSDTRGRRCDQNQLSDISKYFVKKDILLARFSKFNDQPESYLTWKNSFKSVAAELECSPAEELDLLIKYLGEGSGKTAITIRSAAGSNPLRGHQKIWIRLDERFGSPEIIEIALKAKLDKFPKINFSQRNKLFQLVDILDEIQAVMYDPMYMPLSSYFNTSVGISPIVAKLPQIFQNQWTMCASKYKRNRGVAYPPFSEFCMFITEISSTYNDPSFNYVETSQETKSGFRKGEFVYVRKTNVNTHSSDGNMSICPVHKTSDHTLKDCRAFRKKSLPDRRQILKENRICFKCCASKSHVAKNCAVKISCDECGSKTHSTVMHVNFKTSVGQTNENPPVKSPPSHSGEQNSGSNADRTESVNVTCTQVCGDKATGPSCAKIIPVKVYPHDDPTNFMKAYAIIDHQSNCTLARSAFFDNMRVNSNTYPYTLVSCAGQVTVTGRRASGFVIEAIDGSAKMALPTIIECNEVPDNRAEIPTLEVTTQHKHLRGVDLPDLDSDAQILFLIGHDLPDAHIVKDQRTGSTGQPIGQKLSLGWVVIGNVCLGPHTRLGHVIVNKTNILPIGRPTSLCCPCPHAMNVKDHLTDGPPIGFDVFKKTRDDKKK